MSRTRHTRKTKLEKSRARAARAAHDAAVEALINPPAPVVEVAPSGSPVCPLCRKVHMFGSGSCGG